MLEIRIKDAVLAEAAQRGMDSFVAAVVDTITDAIKAGIIFTIVFGITK